MGRKAKSFYHFGKDIPKTEGLRAPFKGSPNSNIDIRYKDTGALHRRRKIGRDGRAIRDYDMPDGHKSNIHVHDILGNIRSSEGRTPTKKEKIEIDKAARKKRIWK